MNKKNILILGAGFGGLRAALLLGKKLKQSGLSGQYEITLVDKNSYHTYTPALYEIATTSKEIANNLNLESIVSVPIKEVISGLPIKFIQGQVKSLNLEDGTALLQTGETLAYAYGVIALGSESNDFGIPGIKQFALPLKTFIDAVKIRDTIFSLLTEFNERAADGTKQHLRIFVGGGGSAGVELAGELAEWVLDPIYKKNCDITVTIIEGMPTILNLFDSRIIEAAEKRLLKLGLKLMVSNNITEITEHEIILKSSKVIPYDLFIWTGGVKAPDILQSLPLQIEHAGKVKVGEEMKCIPGTDHLHFSKMLYGLGDNICFIDPKTQKPTLGVARAAIIQGETVAHNIFEDIKLAEGLTKKAKHKEYSPMNYPYIIPVGGKWAVAKVGLFVFKGFLGWILKLLVELNYLISIMPLKKAFGVWFAGIKSFIKNDRLG